MRMGRMTEDLVGSPIISLATSPQHPKESLLISSADGKVRILDRTNGSMLQTFEGHAAGDKSGRAVWAYGEGGAVCGDEEGRLWCWDVLSVSLTSPKSEVQLKADRQNLSTLSPSHRTRRRSLGLRWRRAGRKC